jgi:hypothetical protein
MEAVLLGKRLAKRSIDFIGFQRDLFISIAMTLAVLLARPTPT